MVEIVARMWEHRDMRYLNMTILASTVLLTLACGDSGNTDGASETATETGTAGETTNETGGSNGDGDGDTNTGDGDGDTNTGDGDGDGDGDTNTGDGDGDGEPGDGDGDGDGEPGDGDGDGDGGCVPLGNTACDACSAENCCDELMACSADQDCACVVECLGQGGGQMCFQTCGVDPNRGNVALMDLRACRMSECPQECAMP
jgi:hypothetical protein